MDTEKRKEYLRNYQKRWREENREYLATYAHNYYITHKEELREYQTEWRHKNPDKKRAQNERYRKKRLQQLKGQVDNATE